LWLDQDERESALTKWLQDLFMLPTNVKGFREIDRIVTCGGRASGARPANHLDREDLDSFPRLAVDPIQQHARHRLAHALR
jgi:hypothetical protein